MKRKTFLKNWDSNNRSFKWQKDDVSLSALVDIRKENFDWILFQNENKIKIFLYVWALNQLAEKGTTNKYIEMLKIQTSNKIYCSTN
jgi:hypothetical protein